MRYANAVQQQNNWIWCKLHWIKKYTDSHAFNNIPRKLGISEAVRSRLDGLSH